MVEDQRDIENPHSASEEHCACDRLHRKLYVRARAAEVIVNAKAENQARRDIHSSQRGRRQPLKKPREDERKSQQHTETDRQCQENCEATKSPKNRRVNAVIPFRLKTPVSLSPRFD